MCCNCVLHCTVGDNTILKEQWGNFFFSSFSFFPSFLLNYVAAGGGGHQWQQSGLCSQRKALAGETERRTYGRVRWTDTETRTRLIISSCVINLDLSTIGREARWSRHPADRSICLHWWICSHTYMRTCARAPAYAHPHTPTRTKRAGWVSLCSAKRPNPPPGWRRSRFSTTADATSYSPSLKVRRSLQSESSGLHQCHAFLLNGSARLAACCLSLLSLPLWCWIAAVVGWAKPSGCMISHFEFGRFVCLDAAFWQRNPPAVCALYGCRHDADLIKQAVPTNWNSVLAVVCQLNAKHWTFDYLFKAFSDCFKNHIFMLICISCIYFC